MEAKCQIKVSSSTLKIELFVALFFCFFYSCSSQIETSTDSIPKNRPFLYVLGIAQDAGFPQAGQVKAWEQIESGQKQIKFATALALVDPVSKERYLFDATPDFKRQLALLDQISSATQYPFNGIFLTHAHMGHYTGLMHLGREAMNSKEIPVYAMPRMYDFLSENGPWSQLVALKNIHLVPIANRQEITLNERITIVPILVPHRDEFTETVGFVIRTTGQSALFIPDIDKWSKWEEKIVDQIKQVDYAFLDATFYDASELKGRSMEEIPHPLVVESMDLFDTLPLSEKSKIHFIHLNNSNPLLWNDSEEYQHVLERGFKVAYKGQIIPLKP